MTFNAKEYLAIAGVDVQVASDWLELRKAKKAPPTRTAIDRLANESLRAGMSLNQALEICCMHGWQGFKAEWMKDKSVGYQDKRQERDSAFLSAIGMSARREERLIHGEVVL